MRLELDESKLELVEMLSVYDCNVYKLPFRLGGYEYIMEEYCELSDEYQYILGYVDEGLFFREVFFIPSERFEIFADNWSNSNDWC